MIKEAMDISVCLYFPKNPRVLFEFLHSFKQYQTTIPNPVPSLSSVEFLLWVDNDDHQTSSEFYSLRKLIRNGMNIQVFINPPLESSEAVFSYLEKQSSGAVVFSNKEHQHDFINLVYGPSSHTVNTTTKEKSGEAPYNSISEST